MRLGWRIGSSICTAGCIAEHIVRCHREGCSSRRATDGNVRSGSPHWTTRSSSTIYGEDFLGFLYGFRPRRSQHQALDALSYALVKRRVNYVIDADIPSFFDSLDKAWMIKFVEHRVADRRILRLIQKWLKAGVSEEGKWSDTETGTPQGAVITPLTQKVMSNLSG
jgi:Reverse transcriptase (RNA-dependent DNA polymerase)